MYDIISFETLPNMLNMVISMPRIESSVSNEKVYRSMNLLKAIYFYHSPRNVRYANAIIRKVFITFAISLPNCDFIVAFTSRVVEITFLPTSVCARLGAYQNSYGRKVSLKVS